LDVYWINLDLSRIVRDRLGVKEIEDNKPRLRLRVQDLRRTSGKSRLCLAVVDMSTALLADGDLGRVEVSTARADVHHFEVGWLVRIGLV
jgi:hypothetical protein